MFLKTQSPQRRDKLILGGALTPRFGSHSSRYMNHPRHRVKANQTIRKQVPVKQTTNVAQNKPPRKQRRLSSVKRVLSQRKQTRRHKQSRSGVAAQRRKSTHSSAPQRRGLSQQTALVRRKQSSLIGKLGSRAQQAVKQLIQSKQVKRAVKGLGRDVTSAAMSKAASFGNRLLTTAVAPALHTGKRSFNDAFSGDEDDNVNPVAKRPAFSSATGSRIGYRGKSIQRGGTKQKCVKFLF